ncbi:protein-methionine-sulfoxide reductase heme-binding subunit MsrQ [Shewanella sp.]|uniref:protein-methionine-sulfoxide reductase heme-binding subunit MsrQ n=1 Tax=Shewanella sp. TaxID=50422 RepID=UPI004047B4F5
MRLSPRHVFWLKVILHIVFLLPALYLIALVMTDNAGGDPVQYIIHYTGMGALNSLLVTLLISPIAKWAKLAALMQTRRLVGLYVFAYALLHVAAFISLDLLFAWGLLFEEVIKRPYILVGAAAFIIVTLLAVTSPHGIKRGLGKRWQSLHNWIYVVALLAPIHFYWSVKSEIIEPSICMVLFVLLLYNRKAAIKKWLLLTR